ncbi:hypothetical protein PsorP6_003700 [Peronosclerospora sorghi]|uniref:Uncharacterized protein n=1 Tax=Peronosclerospora sorghi TaxID=230839 RepID=A0ACC0VNR7_9STRA|nr:hypothetical protein PsorP6_018875 [Peronosclerospora sorghi]KAI9908109.1 hypothetical protein PsorP6_003700 [Peronosclerospora sorghi]
MQSLVDDRTKGILINNPSNPCGSVYSKPQLKMDAKTCSKCARRAFAHGAGSSSTSDERATLGSSSKIARRSPLGLARGNLALTTCTLRRESGDSVALEGSSTSS